MAMLSTSFAIGSVQTSNGSLESLRNCPSSWHLFGKRIFRCEDKVGRQREIVFQEGVGQAKRYPSEKRCIRAQALSSIPVVDKAEQGLSKYLFRTRNGDRVTVAVGRKGVRYVVDIEVLPLAVNGLPEKLILCWGIYTSDSSTFIPLEFQSSAPNGEKTNFEAPIKKNSFGTYKLEMEFESYLAPFYLSFVLKHPVAADPNVSEIKTHRGTNFRVPIGFGSGNPAPLGLSISTDGRVNFALYSRNVESVCLCLFDDDAFEKPALEIELDPYVNRTGDIWHASMDVGSFVSYGYRCKGAEVNGRGKRVLLDPYAKLIRKKIPGLPDLGQLHDTTSFDWTGDVHPQLSMETLVVYRLNVMNFTGDKSSGLPAEISGTFSGVSEKLQHLKDLGVNAVLLEPVFPYNEKMGPYYPFHFFSPGQAYGPGGESVSAINSMKEMVKRMHANGMEVYLEVVFTHIAEDGALQEIDSLSYLYADGNTDLGVVNALKCNFPIVQKLIIDSLRYWVTEFHVDGFCFINASNLLKGFHGESLSRPPLVETIAFDPILSKVKIIADCWDPCDLASKGAPFPHWKRWAEMNPKYIVDVRNFLRGEGLLSNLATRLCGSGDIFSTERGPAFSFNYITRNFGLPLVDLVSFSHSELASELSWNCGEEGPTNNKVVLERRLKQIRNFLFILFVSLGVPVLNIGDECGQSSGGSTAYSDRKPFNWAALNTAFGVQIMQFISYLNSLRQRRGDLLQKRKFLKEENIDWYDTDLAQPQWDDPSAKFLAMVLKAENEGIQQESDPSHTNGDLYVAFNAGEQSENVILPSPPEEMEWVRLVDTALPFPGFFSNSGIPIPEQVSGLITYEMKSYSSVLFEAKLQHD